MDEHPDEAEQIRNKFEEMEKVWNDLRELLKQREESLGEAGNLQKFVRDLDRFQVCVRLFDDAIVPLVTLLNFMIMCFHFLDVMESSRSNSNNLF